MDVIFDHSPHTHITWPTFDFEIDLILDLDLDLLEEISWITYFDRIVSHHYCLLQNCDICMDVIFDHSPHTHITWPYFDIDLILNLEIFKLAIS